MSGRAGGNLSINIAFDELKVFGCDA